MPGSGKTTLAPAIRQRLDELDLPVATPETPAREAAEEYFRTTAPRFWERSNRYLDVAASLRHEAGHGPVERLVRQGRDLWFGRAYAAERAHRDGACVFFEESTVHELWRLTYLVQARGLARAAERDLWSGLTRSGVVVKIAATPATRRRRMTQKAKLGPINRDLAAHAPDSDLWRRSEAGYDRLIRRATRFRSRLVVIDNERDEGAAAAASAVVDVIRRALDGAPQRR